MKYHFDCDGNCYNCLSSPCSNRDRGLGDKGLTEAEKKFLKRKKHGKV